MLFELTDAEDAVRILAKAFEAVMRGVQQEECPKRKHKCKHFYEPLAFIVCELAEEPIRPLAVRLR